MVGLYRGVSGLALGVGLYVGSGGLWNGAVGLQDGGGNAIASLYASGAQGFWADLQGTPQLYTDTAGTTVAALGDSVARVNDRSGRGNHLTQATAGNRPVYARHPKTGIRNLLTYTEDFTNAAWSTSAASIVGGKIVPSATSTVHRLSQIASVTTATGYLAWAVVKASGYNKVGLREGNYTGAYASFDLSSGTKLAEGSGGTGSIVSLGSGEYLIALASTSGGVTMRFDIHVLNPAYTTGAVTEPWTADGVNGVEVICTQLETGSTATAYQKVTGWYDVTEADVPSVPYLYFNGTSTSMATSAIDFSAGDKMTVFAAMRKLSDAGRGTIVELTASAAANNGAFHMTAPNAASATIAFESKGTALVDAVASSGVAAPKTAILTGAGSIAGDTATLRVNGALADTDTGDQGTGNYANAAIYLCARGGSSLYFKGNLYDLAIVAAAQSDATIAAVETKLNSTVGAY